MGKLSIPQRVFPPSALSSGSLLLPPLCTTASSVFSLPCTAYSSSTVPNHISLSILPLVAPLPPFRSGRTTVRVAGSFFSAIHVVSLCSKAGRLTPILSGGFTCRSDTRSTDTDDTGNLFIDDTISNLITPVIVVVGSPRYL